MVGPANWKNEFAVIGENLFCGISIKIDNEWITKFDCGTESNIEKEKGEASDSFKRAAVQWGIGRFLYSLDTKNGNGNSPTPKEHNPKSEEERVKVLCKTCQAEVYWGKTANGSNCMFDWGTNTSHFKNCPDATQHSSKGNGSEKMASEAQRKKVWAMVCGRCDGDNKQRGNYLKDLCVSLEVPEKSDQWTCANAVKIIEVLTELDLKELM